MASGSLSARALSFGAIAEDYDRYRPAPPDEVVRWLLPRASERVIDIGAGTGALTGILTRYVECAIAVEPDLRMERVLSTRVPQASLLCARAEALPLRRQSADAVVGSSMWHWVDERKAAAEAARVLRPGGILGVLWSGPDRSRGWLRELFVRRGAGEQAEVGRPHHMRHQLALPADLPFTAPEVRSLEWSIEVTADDLIGLAGTYSGTIVLPEAERLRLRDRLTRLLHGNPTLSGRKKIDMPMRCTCWRAVRLG